MPPKAATKRSAPAGESQAKKAKTSAAAQAPPPGLAKSKRWAAVSASRNVDYEFKLAVQDTSRAHAYICVCKPWFVEGDDDDDDEEGSSDDEGAPQASRNRVKVKCDGGKNCPTFNDHEAYGFLEICQNMMLDWDEAETWQEQWIVCEGLALFLLGKGQRFYMIDDGGNAAAFAQLIGRLFLTMLARLGAENLLDENAAVKNLGLIMALYIKIASIFRNVCLLDEDKEEICTKPSRFTWTPDRFDDYINAYAAKFGITLRGLDDIEELTADLDTDVSLPALQGCWGWSRSFESYEKRYASSPPMGPSQSQIGGDGLDIITWTGAERKRYNFDRKDPLSAAILKDIKKGMVMCLG